MRKLRIKLARIDVARAACHHLVGEDHRFRHRASIGIAIMLVGVSIAKTYGHSHNPAVAVCCDAVGYSLHGIGLIPFVEGLLALGE